MTLIGNTVPSTVESRGFGASAFADPSSFNRTPAITRIVAVAWTIARAEEGATSLCASGAEANMGSANNSMSKMPNALRRNW